MYQPLTLAEDLLLLAGDGGGRSLPWRVHYGVAGALLAELELAGRIGYSADGHVKVTGSAPARGGELAAVLGEIASDAKPRRVHYWIEDLVSVQRTYRLAARLAGRADLDERRAGLQSRVIEVLAEPSTSDGRARALGAIASACGLAKTGFADRERRGLRRGLAELSRSQPTAAGVRKAIRKASRRAWLPGLRLLTGT